MKFNEDLTEHVPPPHLLKSMGGDVDFKYDHSAYWPALNQLADQRRNTHRERWIQGGKQIGEYENYLKTGKGPSVSQEGTSGKAENGKAENGKAENGETEASA